MFHQFLLFKYLYIDMGNLPFPGQLYSLLACGNLNIEKWLMTVVVYCDFVTLLQSAPEKIEILELFSS